ncbi:hypothetical protein HPB50_023959 [Hyalomma asiaticum]|uniref:Uncharacterized protein n=1 Tax=Hyalomma asiaticum TaxID=266040 RepID=A0ACB7S3G2_HYAAI|nr:hypothetical protein HPB50_023959 [Hyalomma asiaticum]
MSAHTEAWCQTATAQKETKTNARDTPPVNVQGTCKRLRAPPRGSFAAASMLSVDVVLWTGDLPPHDPWKATREDTIDNLRVTSALMRRYFPNATVLPAIGNHEAVPINSPAKRPSSNTTDMCCIAASNVSCVLDRVLSKDHDSCATKCAHDLEDIFLYNNNSDISTKSTPNLASSNTEFQVAAPPPKKNFTMVGDVFVPEDVGKILNKGAKFSLGPDARMARWHLVGKAPEKKHEKYQLDRVDAQMKARNTSALRSGKDPLGKIGDYFQRSKSGLLLSDKERGFVVMDQGDYYKRALEAIRKNFKAVRASDTKVKCKMAALCRDL